MAVWSRASGALAAASAGAAALVLEAWLLLGGSLRALAVGCALAATAAAGTVAGVARRLAPRARPAWYRTAGRVARAGATLGAVYVLTVLVLVGRPAGDERPMATAGLVAAAAVVIVHAASVTAQARGSAGGSGLDPVDAVTERLARPVPLDESIQQIVDVLRRAEGRRAVEIWQRRSGHLALTHAGPLRGADPIPLDARTAGAAARAGVVGSAWLRTWLPELVDGDDAAADMTRVAPLASHGELLGFVVLRRAPGEAPFDAGDEETLTRVQHPLATAMQHARMDAELRARIDELGARNVELQRSRARLVSVADAERRRLERDLHDGAQSHLVALEVKLQLAKALAERNPERAGELIDALEGDLAGAVEELRSLSHGIIPPLLLAGGLRDAVAGAAKRAAVPVTVDEIAPTRFRPEVEAAVYFCCLEALQNVAKHAGPGTTARVAISSDERWLRFVVSDDGVGPAPGNGDGSGGGHGLVNMTDRVGALGGTVTIGGRPNGGTEVVGQVPLAAPDVGPSWPGPDSAR